MKREDYVRIIRPSGGIEGLFVPLAQLIVHVNTDDTISFAYFGARSSGGPVFVKLIEDDIDPKDVARIREIVTEEELETASETASETAQAWDGVQKSYAEMKDAFQETFGKKARKARKEAKESLDDMDEEELKVEMIKDLKAAGCDIVDTMKTFKKLLFRF